MIVNDQLKDLARFLNFKRIFDNLYFESDHTEDVFTSIPFFYILVIIYLNLNIKIF